MNSSQTSLQAYSSISEDISNRKIKHVDQPNDGASSKYILIGFLLLFIMLIIIHIK